MAFLRSFTLFCLCLCLVSPARAAVEPAESPKVVEIKVKGPQSLTEKQVLAVIRQREGELLNLPVINEDVRRIWGMGLFTDVKVTAEQATGGVRLVYQVVERPLVKEFRFFGNKEIGDGALKDKVTLKVSETFDQGKVAESVKAMEALYKDKNYYAAQVSADTKAAPEAGQVIVNFRVSEGIRMKIQKIIVTGNKVFSANKIKGQMRDTKEAGLFGGGSYDPQKIQADLENVLKAYVREGYAKAKLEGFTLDEFGDHAAEVVRKVTEFNEPAREIILRFEVEEGQAYKFKALEIRGQNILTEKEIRTQLEPDSQKIFNKERWEAGMVKVRGAYAAKGYIYAGVNPSYDYDDKSGDVTVRVDISEGSKAYIERIDIRGNEVTKEKVIRREIRIKEGDAFDSEAINRSRMAVYNLGYFENVGLDTQPGSEMDKLVLVYDVSPERKTGTLSVGAGYSSVEGLVGFLQVSQNNLFGNGQTVSAQWDFGNLKNSYSLSFVEPWLLDTPTSLGLELYRISRFQEYNAQGFDQVSTGGSVRLGRRLAEYWKAYATYRYQHDNTYNIRSDLTGIEQGEENISSITPQLARDSRDNIFDTTKGSSNSLAVTLAGGYLGGDKHFAKPVLDSRFFFQTPALFGWTWLNKFVLGLHGRAGFATPFDAGTGIGGVPISERFFMGGTDTVRGYMDRSLGAGYAGGLVSLLTNVEYGFKPAPPLKLRAFYDAGNSWTTVSDFANVWPRPYLYPSVGFGMLFTIPTSVIQIRLDWGFGLDPSMAPAGGRVHFNIGNIF